MLSKATTTMPCCRALLTVGTSASGLMALMMIARTPARRTEIRMASRRFNLRPNTLVIVSSCPAIGESTNRAGLVHLGALTRGHARSRTWTGLELTGQDTNNDHKRCQHLSREPNN